MQSADKYWLLWYQYATMYKWIYFLESADNDVFAAEILDEFVPRKQVAGYIRLSYLPNAELFLSATVPWHMWEARSINFTKINLSYKIWIGLPIHAHAAREGCVCAVLVRSSSSNKIVGLLSRLLLPWIAKSSAQLIWPRPHFALLRNKNCEGDIHEDVLSRVHCSNWQRQPFFCRTLNYIQWAASDCVILFVSSYYQWRTTTTTSHFSEGNVHRSKKTVNKSWKLGARDVLALDLVENSRGWVFQGFKTIRCALVLWASVSGDSSSKQIEKVSRFFAQFLYGASWWAASKMGK